MSIAWLTALVSTLSALAISEELPNSSADLTHSLSFSRLCACGLLSVSNLGDLILLSLLLLISCVLLVIVVI